MKGDLATVGRLLSHAEGSIVTHRYAMGANQDVDRAALAAVAAARAGQVSPHSLSTKPVRASKQRKDKEVTESIVELRKPPDTGSIPVARSPKNP